MTSNEIIKMTNSMTFDDIFYDVAHKHNLAWYELFESDLFEEVNELICAHFNVADPSDVECYDDWYAEMCAEL